MYKQFCLEFMYFSLFSMLCAASFFREKTILSLRTKNDSAKLMKDKKMCEELVTLAKTKNIIFLGKEYLSL